MHTDNDIPLGYTRVTEVLQPYSTLGGIDAEILAKAADRGKRVHAFCECHALGLFLPHIDDDCKNYFEVFKAWFDTYVDKVYEIEKRVNDPELQLTGGIDLICSLRGSPEICIVDYKTPSCPSLSWQLQTAAYQYLSQKMLKHDISRRFCLMLPKYEKNPKIVEYHEHAKDQQKYLNALELYRFFNH